MKATVVIAAALLTPAAAAVAQPAPRLLPTPAHIEVRRGGFTLTGGTPLVATDAAARNAAARLADLMRTQGLVLGAPRVAVSGPAVRFVRAPGMAAEAYRLVTGTDGATITASDEAGLFYGAVTLWQLATQNPRHDIAAVAIDDRPRFSWRGVMLDSARHFQSPAYVRRLIDWMAVNKLNRLHWHLADDQGWRLEIRRYPRLTDVSAWRRPATAPGAPALPTVGGFYTQAEVREIVAYASARGIVIVPEIEMPGHALAAIRAYPELGMGVAVPPGTESDWGVFPWLYNTDDATFGFLENVLAEVTDLFPSPWIHVGGDEAVKDQWRRDAATQARIKALGLKDEEALQGWFVARIGRFLKARGRRLIGWDEVLDGGVPANATVMSWRGVDGALKAARAGHDTVLSPAPTLYFDNRQGSGPEEPPGRGNLITLADVLAFDPMPAGLTSAQSKHVLGLQANLWTEHIRTEDRAAWMTFPRAAAIAETGWAGAGKRDVATFSRALAPQMARMTPLGLVAADSAWAVTARLDVLGDATVAALSNQAGLPIRYTRDGSAPTAESPIYKGPLMLANGQRLRAATWLDGRALPGAYDAAITSASARVRTSRELTPCSSAVLLDLEDDYPAKGPRAHFLIDAFNPCWRWPTAPLAGAKRIAVSVGQLPFNFQVGRDRDKIRFRAPATPAGEFEVRDGCEGERLAVLPLAAAAGNPGVTRLVAPLPPRNGADLCVTYTARGVDPLWAVERVELLP